jgi:protein-tyrosine phosphatase
MSDRPQFFNINPLVCAIHFDWKAGKRVLIHWKARWNRSGPITGLVLMREGHSAESAIDLIRERRSFNALCNSTFEQYLKEQEGGDVGIH